MYEKAVFKRKIEQGSTLTFTRDLPYIAFMLFTRVKFARAHVKFTRDGKSLHKQDFPGKSDAEAP